MNCNIIKDLLPLYIDKSCSEESAKIIEEHLSECAECKTTLENMTSIPVKNTETDGVPTKPKKTEERKAYVLQSVSLFLSFIIITVGVALEAATPSGSGNGFWAFFIVVPTTGFMLSLANWYFVRLYKTKRKFANLSCFLTAVITIFAYIPTVLHYEINLLEFLTLNYYYIIILSVISLTPGLTLTIIFCLASRILSAKYAKMLGKK